MLRDFEQICKIDLRLKDRTIYSHLLHVRRYLAFCQKQALAVDSIQSTREFLSTVKDGNQNTYGNYVKALRVFFREYLRSDEAERFKVPQASFRYVKVPSKEELRLFYEALPDWRSKALFLFYASSGRRRDEILDLDMKDVDFELRMLRPLCEESQTKHTWFSFFNEEALKAYRRYREKEDPSDGKLFGGGTHVNQVFKETSEKAGVKITPQLLREWFCNELGGLGVADRYIDAFCGRVPRSVLARHYTDFGPERLKEIYDKAGLRVLTYPSLAPSLA